MKSHFCRVPIQATSVTKAFLWAALAALVTTTFSSAEAYARAPRAPSIRGPGANAPVILDAAYRSNSSIAALDRDATTRNAKRLHHREHLWIHLDPSTVDGDSLVLEPVWGSGTGAMSHLWGRTHLIRNGEVYAHPNCRGGHRDQPFTLGFRVRVVHQDGSLSPPSAPVFITYQGDARSSDGIRADTVFLVIVSCMLFGLFLLFRRETKSDTRIRLAAAAALASLLFLTVTPALSWFRIEDSTVRRPAVDCSLGDERQCATYVPDGGPNPVAATAAAAPRRLELAQWMACSASVRSGLVLSLILLLPSLIWLLVVPRLRSAQCSVFIGATAAGYTLLSTVFYLLTVPDWMTAIPYHAADVTLLCCSGIVLATALMLKESFTSYKRSELPGARVHRTRDS